MGMLGATVFDSVMSTRASRQSVLERYTEATRRAIYHAREECHHRGDSVITVGDLLCGLMLDENTRAERIGALKSNAYYLRWLVGSHALPSPISEMDGHFDESQVQLDAEAKRAFEFALMEADRDREYWVDTDHLLRGLLRFPNKAHFAVLKTELTLSRARIASRRDREEYLPEETPNLKVVQYLVRKYATLWIPPVLGLACYLYILVQSIGVELPSLAK